MRFARTALGLLLTLAGLVVTLAGAVAAFWLVGPDNTITTGSRQFTSQGLAIITAPDLLDRHGPTLHVTASGDRPVFVGVGQDLDVANYLSGTAHTRLIRFDPPATYGTQEMRGRSANLTPPGELDWWVAQAGGSGRQSVAWPIQDGRYDVVVMNADGTPAVGADVRFGVEVDRAFGICLLVLGAGILALTFGLMLTFRRRSATAPAAAPTRITPVPAIQAAITPGFAGPSPFAPAAAEAAPAYRAPAIKPTEQRESITTAPMLMSPVAVAKAKSPAFLIAVGAVADDEEPGYDETTYAEDAVDPEPVRLRVVEPETVSLEESPEFERSDEAVRKTAALLASGALLLTTTSCGLLPAKNSEAAPETRPAVTLADAQAVVQRYNQLNNQANQARDAKVAETIEANPTLTQTRAGYLIGRKLDAAGKDKSKPFTFTEPQIGAPEFGSYPMRFVVSSGLSTDPGSRQLGVWQRQSAGTPWLLTNTVYPLKSVKLPSMEGLRTPDQADLDSLYSLPSSAATNLAAYLTEGATSANAKLFVPSPGTTTLLERRAKAKVADTKETYIASVSDKFAPSGEPLTFITSTGEALVFVTLTEQYLQRVEPGSNAYWTSGEATAFSSMVKYTQTLHQDYLYQAALVIPTKATGGTIRVLSIDGQLVGAGGS
ncbi:hypothetical protein EV652_12633 [Kribbella steppae]|uniref:DUF8094 domain-containing protein n=1 Tax=Kribbella steppae TaxID=2512223 RepID=A0A4R2GSZ5_9ACTN|nr:hypothetical protein [Kribbella steppae]TCO13493.1 hypothetical protein EV652_12633 [Kribbella steppae]